MSFSCMCNSEIWHTCGTCPICMDGGSEVKGVNVELIALRISFTHLHKFKVTLLTPEGATLGVYFSVPNTY